MRQAHAVLLASALVALVSLVSPSPALSLPILHHSGRWLVDSSGRVVVLHGVQIDSFEPTRPVEFIDMSPENVRFLAAEGFNLARVSFAYAGFEPRIEQFDPAYLRQYLAFDRVLAGAGVYDLLDMMQGQYSAPLEGWGFPPWMTITGGAANNRQKFPEGYFANPAEEKAWDNLWSDKAAADHVGLQEHYAFGLRLLSGAFSHSPGFLGFDLLNEPWPGSSYPGCASAAGCAGFDQRLRAFYRGLVGQVRGADSRGHPIFYEPHFLFDQGAKSHLGAIGDANAVFAFHNYCALLIPSLPPGPGGDCALQEQFVLQNADAQASASGDGLLMDEWGDDPNTALLKRMTAEADAARIGWSYWAYEDCCDSPGALVNDATVSPTLPGNLNVPVLRAIVRPYPKLIAGTPGTWSYKPSTNTFKLAYLPKALPHTRLQSHAQTEIELPALRYRTGYTATVHGARVVSPPDANRLRLANKHARLVIVTVTPARHHAAGLGPFSWARGSHPAGERCCDCAAPARFTRAALSCSSTGIATRRGTAVISAGSRYRVVSPTGAHFVCARSRRRGATPQPG